MLLASFVLCHLRGYLAWFRLALKKLRIARPLGIVTWRTVAWAMVELSRWVVVAPDGDYCSDVSGW